MKSLLSTLVWANHVVEFFFLPQQGGWGWGGGVIKKECWQYYF